jgi:hypothetical protein
LLRLLGEGVPGPTRQAAVGTLGRIGQAAVQALLRLLGEGAPDDTRREAAWALERIAASGDGILTPNGTLSPWAPGPLSARVAVP